MTTIAQTPQAHQRHTKGSEKAFIIYKQALKGTFTKLNPKTLVQNPVMFIVEIGLLLSILHCFFPNMFGQNTHTDFYSIWVTVILFLTVLFSNFAEAYAEGRGKAQADTLRKTKSDTQARRLSETGEAEWVPANALRAGDTIRIEAGEWIPADGEVIAGIASVDESAITGESAPVIKEPGTDMSSSVTGGTQVRSDWLHIRVSSNPGESFLDKMVALVEGAKRQKTPNEIALTVVLATLTLGFLAVCFTLVFYATYFETQIDLATLIALLVCLIPTTIGALLSAIGIAGMHRVSRFNVVAMSGKAVEACGDIGVVILDKTGTITIGNRVASEFIPVSGKTVLDVAKYGMLASQGDTTPEGKSIVTLAHHLGVDAPSGEQNTTLVPFSAETRSSGTDFSDGTSIRKGATDAIKRFVTHHQGVWHNEVDGLVTQVAKQGGTPLVIAKNGEVLGIVHLKDIVKPGMRERFADMRAMGICTVMCTGDNPITAQVIATEAGVDTYIAEAKPEDKLKTIKHYQAQGMLVAMTGDGTNDAPALAQADVGLAMNSGTHAAKEAANMIDLDSDPSKLIDVVSIGKQLLITRGALTTFSIANDIAKYFAIIPAIFATGIPAMHMVDVMHLGTSENAVLSALLFNALIIPLLIPLALKGVHFKPMSANKLLIHNSLIFGLGGVITPFIGIKCISIILGLMGI